MGIWRVGGKKLRLDPERAARTGYPHTYPARPHPGAGGTYELRLERNGEELLQAEVKNAVTQDGLDLGYSILFHKATASPNWYIGLSQDPPSTTITTEFTGYSESTRPAWSSSVVSIGNHQARDPVSPDPSLRVESQSFAKYTITSTGFLRSVFLVDNFTKGGSLGTVWSNGALSTARVRSGATLTKAAGTVVVWPGDILQIAYILKDYGDGGTFLQGSKLFLDCMFKGTSAPNTWYAGLAAYNPTFARGDTLSSHPGWLEVTDYHGSERVCISSISTSNSPVFGADAKDAYNYYMTANSSVGGIFIVADGASKGGTTGFLYSWSRFDAARSGGTADQSFALFAGEGMRTAVSKGEYIRVQPVPAGYSHGQL